METPWHAWHVPTFHAKNGQLDIRYDEAFNVYSDVLYSETSL